jgi:hypothetical protein
LLGPSREVEAIKALMFITDKSTWPARDTGRRRKTRGTFRGNELEVETEQA